MNYATHEDMREYLLSIGYSVDEVKIMSDEELEEAYIEESGP